MQPHSVWRAQHGLRYSKHKELNCLSCCLVIFDVHLICPTQGESQHFVRERRKKGEKELRGNTCVYMEVKGMIKHLRCISVTLESFTSELSQGEISVILITLDMQGYASPSYHLYNHCLLFIQQIFVQFPVYDRHYVLNFTWIFAILCCSCLHLISLIHNIRYTAIRSS